MSLCRFCNNELKHSFVDLGMSPLANAYIAPGNLQKMEGKDESCGAFHGLERPTK